MALNKITGEIRAAYRLDNVEDLLTIVRNTGRRTYVQAFNDAITASRLNGLVNIRSIGELDTDFSYTPSIRRHVMGEVTPASCDSKVTYVDDAGGEPQWGRAEAHETGYKLCIANCRDETPADVVRKKERATAEVLVAFLWHKFWHGNPQRLQYGLLNHPLTQVVESPPTGTQGSSKWKDKTNSQIMQEIRKYTKYMLSPRILISEKVYNESLGTANTSATGSESSCALRLDCIMRMLQGQEGVTMEADAIKFMEEMDTLAQFAGNSVALIYDASAMVLTSSGPIYTTATVIDSKNVEAIRGINTAGVQIDYTDAVFLVTGI